MTAAVELEVAGKIYAGWTSVSVTRALNRIASSFEFTAENGVAAMYDIPLSAACRVLFDGKAVLSGFVDEIRPRYSATTHEVSFAGRSKTCDLADCSAVVSGGQFLGEKVSSIISAVVSPFGVPLRFSGSDPVVPDWQIEVGETVHGVVERAARIAGLVYTDDGDGALVMKPLSSSSAAAELVLSVSDGDKTNVLSASARYSSRETFRDYVVKSQTAGSDFLGGEDITAIEGKATDANVLRYRPLVVIAEKAMDAETAERRAEYERAFRRGRATSLSYAVRSWQNGSGKPWQVGDMVSVRDDFLRAYGSLVVSEVSFQFSAASGETVSLKLSPPDAFLLKEEVKAKDAFGGWAELKDGV